MRGFTQKLMIRQYNYGNKSDSLSVVSSPRGSDLGIESMHYIEEKEADTVMWNPIHFAIYNNKLEVVRYLIQNKDVNPMLCL